jgi:ABC-2 type transport system permease protein
MTAQQSKWIKKELIPLWSLMRMEITRFFRASIQTILTPVITSILYFLVFGVNLGNNLTIIKEKPYLEFLIPGLIIMGILNNSYQNSSSSILISKFHGSFEDFKILPFRPYQIIFGMVGAAILRGILVGGLTGAVGAIFLWHYHTSDIIIFSWPLLILFASAAGYFFGALGVSVGIMSKTFEQITAVSSFALIPLIYLGGVFFPLDTLDPFWQGVSLYNPLVYYIQGFRYAVLGVQGIHIDKCITVMVVSLAGVHLLAHTAIIKGSYKRW